MKAFVGAALGCAAVFATACAPVHAPREPNAGADLGPPVERNGTVYTPAGVGAEGCILYNISVPGGYAVTAMAYQDAEGRFSLGRPERCVRSGGWNRVRP